MVYTGKILAFSTIHDEDVIDLIPLDEIVNIKIVDFHVDNLAHDDESEESSNKKVLRLETSQDGYNSGRVYQLRARSAKDFEDIEEDIKKLSSIARAKAEAKSKFRKSQEVVARIFNSDSFQLLSAILIIAVSSSSLLHGQILSGFGLFSPIHGLSTWILSARSMTYYFFAPTGRTSLQTCWSPSS